MSDTTENDAARNPAAKTAGKAGAKSGPKRSQPKSARRRSRELALQGLYQWLISGEDAGVIDAHMREQDELSLIHISEPTRPY